MSASVGRNEPCPCGSGVKFKRCCADRPRVTRDAVGGLPQTNAELTLVVDTPRGPMVRRVRSASPLPPGAHYGTAAEDATHDAAAVWGLPDFVYLPEQEVVGSRTRELGDGIIVVGQYAVVVQVKGREVPSQDEARERRWLAKKTADAARQGTGTIRQMRTRPRELTNARGRRVTIDATKHRWLVAVVIDHPDPPQGVVPELARDGSPTVVLLRRDWEFLFEQLKSTYAVAQYLERVSNEASELGTEPARYYDCAQADAAAKPQVLAPALLGAGVLVSTPLLPLAPAASGDRAAHQVMRTMLEDIALTRFVEAGEEERLRVLGELDRLPVGQRELIGEFMLEGMREAVQPRDDVGVSWKLRSLRGEGGSVHLGFGVCSHVMTPELQHGFGSWVQLRHYDLHEAVGGAEDLTSVGVLLSPRRRDDGRPWDTTMAAVSGRLTFTAAELRDVRELWPTPSAPA